MTRAAVAMLAILVLSGAAGCAGLDGPVVDWKRSEPGLTSGTLNVDLAECREYAEEMTEGAGVSGRPFGGVSQGGVVSGLGGSLSGTDLSPGGAYGGMAGAMSGGVPSGHGALDTRGRVLDDCLRGRGYAISRE